ncbi:GIY-YIG nuclease family protein [Caulobacter sp. S45]|uniref:GIY-YIG nuclease family protein n=1 Tax=Caulobacter sp. S45 TaxID=1641861 RepID=UPI0021103F55|nr:GIY-YIG nuclease family protein [Caulobacter sp. S45]
MASQTRGTIYTGMTSDLSRRAFEHREGAIDGFTQRYGCLHVECWCWRCRDRHSTA